MVNFTIKRAKCETCTIKIPKTHPKLYCSICNKLKHLSCQKLTKADASLLIYLKILWTCKECLSDALPVNACSVPRRTKNECTIQKFKVKCKACTGFSYSTKNVRTCYYCDQQVHVKCWNNSLGCIKCCEEIIPGFHAYTYELLGNPYLNNDKVYNPYSSSNLTQLIGEILENEENNKHSSDAAEILINCKYKQPCLTTASDDFELSIFSLNIRTLLNKIENMRDNISLYEKFDVLLLNETNCIKAALPNGLADISLPGFYDPVIQDPIRCSGKGGGLAIYVNKRICSDEDNIKPFTPFDESENSGSGEFQFVRILECKGRPKTVILGNVYRSPSKSPDKFNKFYDAILQKLNTNRYANKIKFIAGDFNQDLIKHEDDVDCQNLIDSAHNHGFTQIVSRPTRITEHSATLIDHVYTSNIETTLSCNILTLDISDHLATHTKLSLGTNTRSPHRRNPALFETKKSECRMFNEASNKIFENLIKNEAWSQISIDMDTQTAYTKFEEIYMKHYNAAYPLKVNRVRRINERQNPKPWILPWLEDACARRQTAYHEFVKRPSPDNKKTYDKLNLFCNKHIDLAKMKYRKAFFDKHKDNSRKQWQMINTLLNRKNKTSHINKLTCENGSIINKPESIANSFNDYFSNIASSLKRDTRCSTRDHQQFLNNPVSRSMYLNSADAGEIHKTINGFKNKATVV